MKAPRLFLVASLALAFPLRAEPLQVYILAGQSNMQGHAKTETFAHLGMDPATAPLLAEMQDESGNPRVADQVWISYLSQDLEKSGKLTAGFGATDEKIGPEFTFGLTMAKLRPGPILLIKTAWGGKSLHTDFRPPSAGPYVFSDAEIENLEKRGRNVAEARAEKEAATGHYYRLMMDHVKKVLGDIPSVVPDYDSTAGYRLAGFVWFQGWNDLVDGGVYPERDKPGGYDAYSEAMAHFIRDVRKDLEAPELPFVIGVLGVGGPTSTYGEDRQRYVSTHQNFRDAMAAPAALPEFQGNVFPVLTENYWDPQLQDLTSRDETLKQDAKKAAQDSENPGRAQQEILETMRAEHFSAEEREVLTKGVSNQAYHYLGSAKILGQIGQAFAQALAGVEAPPRSASSAPAASAESRSWTQASTGKQLEGELLGIEQKDGKAVIRIQSKGRVIPVPLDMLVDTDKAYVAAWQAKQGGEKMSGAPQGGAQQGQVTDETLSGLAFAPIPDGIPDFTEGGKVPEPAKHDWNLGPTGVRGWIHSSKMDTTEARQILVTEVAPGSPAEEILEKGDVILGIGATPFSHDPRVELGKAIGQAEATDGQLSLIRWRDGEIGAATVSLPVLGAYSATAPFDCPKSQAIFEQGCEKLAAAMKANPEAGNPIIRSYNALALLASGNPDYLPIVRDQVERFRNYTDPERRSYHSWFYGPITILVAEYTIATGDQEFLPDLERLAREISLGQSHVGSWGHRFVQENGILAGYGMMNAPGLPLSIALALAREAGIDDSSIDEAIERSVKLVRFYTGKGSIPYGDHHPWTQTHDDNGKNGAAAVLFNVLEDPEPAEFFSRMAVTSHGAEREMGHTGNFFNLLWAMPSVALSGPEASGAWMTEYGWYLDLARQWDGTFRHQGPAQEKNDSYHGWDSTGAYLLSYAQPLRTIHLAGKKQGIVPLLDRAAAESLVADGRDWSPREKDAPYADRDEETLLRDLRSWSPVIRERAALAFSKRDDAPVRTFVAMLGEEDLHARTGACQALAALKAKAAPAVSELRETLKADDLWLRIKAAEALAAIGPEAKVAVPELLQMLATTDPENDPRGMEERYLCFALFDRRDGLLRGSLDGIDREALFAAVRAGLANEDGRARGAIGTVYQNLDYEELAPLLPAIIDAVAAPAPSGIMFADGIRLSGLEILAKNRHREGLDHFVDVLGADRWGQGNRIPKCLEILQHYGGAAKPLLPQLKAIEEQLLAGNNPSQPILQSLRDTMKRIEEDRDPPELRSAGG